ncbi:hypothetical protein K470DRAFT_268444 [Piedraia hortae CBS 480.64]|uniref:Large ribosomal subunit protein mL67 n=1 Tax=Piedraia hortae CBS 480.64 TaxID=1314780 RepID=A0A6A7C7N7_9PEZI|nr:hypothetical protein K470DRAFT_268444 [Piedraia hortae CBS 480.64]
MQRVRPAWFKSGRNIYAYSHVRTNQVVYSDSHVLKNLPALAQLPDLGANTKDRALRRDLWRPLFALTFPKSPSAELQAEDAAWRLHNWRSMHEYHWRPTELLKRQYTVSELDELQKKLDQRGGSKKETPWDLIKRMKKKERIKIVQDQKANSIADLAAVLIHQNELASRAQESIPKMQSLYRKKELALYSQLIQDATDDKMLRNAKLLKRLRDQFKGEAPSDATKFKAWKKAGRLIKRLETKQTTIKFIHDAVKAARGEHAKTSSAASEVRGGNDSSSPDDWTHHLPPLPPFIINSLPKNHYLATQSRRTARDEKLAGFGSKDVVIRWANELDKDFAKKWPDDVTQVAMGWSRHTAPQLDEHVVEDADAWREKRWQAMNRNWAPPGTTFEEGQTLWKQRQVDHMERRRNVEAVKTTIMRELGEQPLEPRETNVKTGEQHLSWGQLAGKRQSRQSAPPLSV